MDQSFALQSFDVYWFDFSSPKIKKSSTLRFNWLEVLLLMYHFFIIFYDFESKSLEISSLVVKSSLGVALNRFNHHQLQGLILKFFAATWPYASQWTDCHWHTMFIYCLFFSKFACGYLAVQNFNMTIRLVLFWGRATNVMPYVWAEIIAFVWRRS